MCAGGCARAFFSVVVVIAIVFLVCISFTCPLLVSVCTFYRLYSVLVADVYTVTLCNAIFVEYFVMSAAYTYGLMDDTVLANRSARFTLVML